MARISVLLPVKNGEKYLLGAAESILDQTWTDLELIVIDDASAVRAEYVLEHLSDRRVKLITLDKSVGVSAALAIGATAASGDVLARQDHDDWSHPKRLELQMRYLRDCPKVGLLGTWARVVPESGTAVRPPVDMLRHEVKDGDLRLRLLWSNPFVHSSIVVRMDSYQAAGGYQAPPTGRFPEDFDLWSRISRVTRLANLPQPLVTYRHRESGESVRRRNQVAEGVVTIAAQNLLEAADSPGDPLTCRVLAAHLNRLKLAQSDKTTIRQTAGALHRAIRGVSATAASMQHRAVARLWLRYWAEFGRPKSVLVADG